MRRIAVIALTCAFLLPAAAAGRAAPAVEANLRDCHPHPEQAKRYAVFEGLMRGKRTVRMEIRFDLQRADPGGAFARVSAPGLSVWTRAEQGVVRYRYRKRVENLPAPASYRAHVLFRWRNRAGKVVRHEDGITPACEQPLEQAS